MNTVPKLEFYEKAVTELSGLLMRYIKEAGGYNTAEGNKFGRILHDMNGAFGNVHLLLNSQRRKIEALEATARKEIEDIDHHRLLVAIQNELVPEKERWHNFTPEMEAIAESIIKLGWKPPEVK